MLTKKDYIAIVLAAGKGTRMKSSLPKVLHQVNGKFLVFPILNNLIKMGFENSPKMSGLVYKSALSFLKGQSSEADAIQRAKFDLHAYIRRQQTWFKHNKDIVWFDISDSEYKQKVIEFIRAQG